MSEWWSWPILLPEEGIGDEDSRVFYTRIYARSLYPHLHYINVQAKILSEQRRRRYYRRPIKVYSRKIRCRESFDGEGGSHVESYNCCFRRINIHRKQHKRWFKVLVYEAVIDVVNREKYKPCVGRKKKRDEENVDRNYRQGDESTWRIQYPLGNDDLGGKFTLTGKYLPLNVAKKTSVWNITRPEGKLWWWEVLIKVV